jgi:hypothetical protein
VRRKEGDRKSGQAKGRKRRVEYCQSFYEKYKEGGNTETGQKSGRRRHAANVELVNKKPSGPVGTSGPQY